MEWMQFFIMIMSIIGMYWNLDRKIDENRKETNNILKAIQEEIKEFHGRLCALEEKIRSNK